VASEARSNAGARIVVPDDAPPVLAHSAAWPVFLREYPEAAYYDSLPGASLLDRIGEAEIVINIRSSTQFSEAVFAACPRLKMISIWGTGTDNIDLKAAKARGISVTNTPGVSAPSIAEHTIALLFAVARRIVMLDTRTRAGEWVRGEMTMVAGKTLGVIGLGAIGKRVAELGRALGMKVVAWTFHPEKSPGYDYVPLEELLAVSDVVSVHLRLSETTKNFLDRGRLELLKPTAILLNTARGAIVDEAALVETLANRRIAGAGLDVFETEPLPPNHPLTRPDNVVLTPHCAGITPEVLEAGLALALENVRGYLAGRLTHSVLT
jgi:D-3-phosphoglycerate dehydrogenase